jgi:hypothetical protein
LLYVVGTHEEAREALVRAWAQATRAGQSALLVATRNDDVGAMNELAREALRERLGEERVYATDFGERVFGIGELLGVVLFLVQKVSVANPHGYMGHVRLSLSNQGFAVY